MLGRVSSDRGTFRTSRDRLRSPAAVVLAAILLAALGPTRAGAQELFTISPGHEDLVLAMAGGSERLPGGCAVDGVSIDHVLVSARYRCDDGSTPGIVLRHPSTSSATLRTAAFAIEPSPDAPPALVEAIVSRIRARDAEFRWDVSGMSPGPQPSEPWFAIALAVAAAVIALSAAGAVVWWRRRRRAAA